MMICNNHLDRLKDEMELQGFNPREDHDATHQAQALILANAIARDAKIAFSPPRVCPICELPLQLRGNWLNGAAKSIASERAQESQ